MGSDYDIPVLAANGSLISGTVKLQSEPSGRVCRISCLLADNRAFSNEDWNYWPAFLQLRENMEAVGLRLKCFGSCENMVLSGMCMDMGNGLVGYLVQLGHRASAETLTEILKTAENIAPVSVARQAEYRQRWEKSLGKRRSAPPHDSIGRNPPVEYDYE